MTTMRFPFSFDRRGRTAEANPADRIRQLIEQVVFTSLGERVNRPTFGSDAARLVFAPNGDLAASATQLVVQGALTQWLADLAVIQAVDVVSDDAALTITIRYVIRATQEPQIVHVVQSG
ncbi:GPW/gp25 family protein [Pendulispora albinea]|uniref:GPW/gp25 family protein n=1 Tax=Pendulispora albinea TaxID=2741071 RepID=A0ABZ2MAS7_9BACT